MTDICDLLRIIQQAPYNKLANVQVFGQVVKVIPEVTNSYANTYIQDDCLIVEMKLFAVKFLSTDFVRQQSGEYNEDHMYFCNGSIATCISSKNSKTIIGDYWSITGRLSQPKEDTSVINLFNFRKSRTGAWVIAPMFVEDIDADRWSETFKEYVIKSCSSNTIVQPPAVLNFEPCKSYGSIGNSDKKDIEVKPTKVEDTRSVEDTKLNGDLAEAVDEGYQNDTTNDLVKSDDNDFTVEEQSDEEDKSERLSSNVLKLQIESNFQKKQIKKLKFKDYNLLCKGKARNFDKLDDLCFNLSVRQKAYLEEFSKRYPLNREDDVTPYVESLLTNLIRYWTNKPTGLTRTGRTIVKDYLDHSGIDLSEPYLGGTVGKFLMSLGSNLLQYTLGVNEIECTGSAMDSAKILFGTPEVTYAGLLGVITGLDVSSMRVLAIRCVQLGISFSNLVNSNPYSLVLLSTALNFNNIEKLALCLGKANDVRVRRGKNVALLFHHMMTCSNGNTIYSKLELLQSGVGVNVTKKDYMSIRGNQPIVPKAKQDELVAYVNSKLTLDSWKYSSVGWQRQGYGYVQPLSANDLSTTINDLTMSGIGTELKIGNDYWICSTVHLSKELFVYQKAYQLAMRTMPYNKEDIEKYIVKFENMKGFKLEDRQRTAVYLVLCGAGAVTGGAGSGKTTISECIVYVLRHLKRNIRVQFGAPTGKASKRLQEVVGEPTSTMHSMFGLMAGDKDLFDEVSDEDDASNEPDVYIFDENAMSTLDLMYNVFKHINRAQVFFLGDIDQLPPIGKGLPFRTLLQFIPYVALNVSKRSKEGSMITRNSDIIKNHSERDDWQDLISDGNCRLIECADDEIHEIVNDLCKWHLGVSKIKPEGAVDGTFGKDDIQVVSPVKTDKYTWGTAKMNPLLQNTFCPYEYGQSFVHAIGDNIIANYRIGDRVINVNTDYSMVHYSTWKNGNLTMMSNSLGVTNGDVGTIVGVLPSTICKVRDCEIEDKHEPRDDKAWNGDNKFFVVVEFPDYEAGGIFYSLYRCTLDSRSSSDLEKVFNGSDLSSIELAYALSTHKMQGSQSKLIIVALGAMKNASFLTRNMVYTALTRGEDLVYLVGNVGNSPSSALSVARTLLASDNTVTVADVALLN